MATIVLVAGPPTSAAMWSALEDRLRDHGHRTHAVELFDPAPADPTPAGLARVLATTLAEIEQPILVAHGTAIPVALLAAEQHAPAALVLTNGSLGGLDPVTAAVCRLARSQRLFSTLLLHPRIWLRWLASSAGLRRTVVNPYVMDRDTVVALCGPLLQSGAHRRAVTTFLAALPEFASQPPRIDCPTLLLWGDEDPLQPSHVADSARRWLPSAEVAVVPGGQHFHPLERPWAMADQLDQWLAVKRSPQAVAG